MLRLVGLAHWGVGAGWRGCGGVWLVSGTGRSEAEVRKRWSRLVACSGRSGRGLRCADLLVDVEIAGVRLNVLRRGWELLLRAEMEQDAARVHFEFTRLSKGRRDTINRKPRQLAEYLSPAHLVLKLRIPLAGRKRGMQKTSEARAGARARAKAIAL